MDAALVLDGNISQYTNMSSRDNHSAWETRDEQLAMLEVAMMGVCFGIALMGNLAVLIVLLLRRQKITRMYYFIFHLSIADLCVAFFNILPQMIWDITWRFQGNNFMCKTIKFLQVFAMYLSAWVLVMMSYDRRRAICYPLDNYSWRGKRCQIMILVAWLLSAICSFPQLFVFSQREIPQVPGVFDCWASFIEPWGSKVYVVWFALSIYIIPLVMLFITYGQVTWTVVKVIRLKENGTLRIKPSGKTKIVDRSRSGSSFKSTLLQSSTATPARTLSRQSSGRTTHSTYRRVYNRTKLLTVKLTAVVILCYIVCWSPFIFALLWTTFFPFLAGSFSEKVFTILLLLANLNSCTNPWIYLFFSLRKFVRCDQSWSKRWRTPATATASEMDEDHEPPRRNSQSPSAHRRLEKNGHVEQNLVHNRLEKQSSAVLL